MNKFKEILNDTVYFLGGKKTYIAALGLLIYGIIQKDVQTILVALGMMGIRNAI